MTDRRLQSARRAIPAAVVLAAVVLAAGAAGSVAADHTETPGTTKQADGLGPGLAGLVDAADRANYSERHGITYRDGRARVVVELAAGTDLPSGYDATVERTYEGSGERLVQAMVAVDDLRPLAAEDRVERVRLPESPGRAGGPGETRTDPTDDGSNRALPLVGLAAAVLGAAAVFYRRR